MKVQDIFRQMLDDMDGIGGHTTSNPANSMRGTDAATMVMVPVDNTDETESSTMISPLQAQAELVKQGNLPSEEDHDCGCQGPCECDDAPDYEEEDEVGSIQRLAGIPSIMVM